MIFNDEDLGIEKVEAFYIQRKTSKSECIEVFSKKGYSICFDFNNESFDPRSIEIGETVNFIKYINWDVSLATPDSYYLFDITKDVVKLKRLEDNLFNIEVKVENPDMIYSPIVENKPFNNLLINVDFSFEYEDK